MTDEAMKLGGVWLLAAALTLARALFHPTWPVVAVFAVLMALGAACFGAYLKLLRDRQLDENARERLDRVIAAVAKQHDEHEGVVRRLQVVENRTRPVNGGPR